MKKLRESLIVIGMLSTTLMLIACHAQSKNTQQTEQTEVKQANLSTEQQNYKAEKFAKFSEPWAVQTLADGRLLITERKGKLKLFDPKTKQSLDVVGVPKVAYGGQGGLGDIALHPNFAKNHIIYLSYAEAENSKFGAVVIQAELDLSTTPQLKNIKTIWKQVPKVSGQGHYSHRILFDQDGKLWISSGERQKFDPAQDMNSNLGKILRLNDDGSPALGNPFFEKSGVSKQIWSLGHRNPLGIAFDHKGQLWDVEMGPQGGDELNIVLKGENYGYPIVSNGDHYSGVKIPDHNTRPEFKAPEISWTPVISPSSLIFYQANQFPLWKNKALIGGLSSQSIVVVDTESQPVVEIQRLDMKQRIRDLQEAQDGSIWVLEDGENANLLKLTAP